MVISLKPKIGKLKSSSYNQITNIMKTKPIMKIFGTIIGIIVAILSIKLFLYIAELNKIIEIPNYLYLECVWLLLYY